MPRGDYTIIQRYSVTVSKHPKVVENFGSFSISAAVRCGGCNGEKREFIKGVS